MNKPKDCYQQKIEELSGEIDKLKAKDRRFLMSEIYSFLGAITVLLVVFIARLDYLWLLLTAVGLGANVVLRYFDAKREKAIHQRNTLLTIYRHELAALDGDFSAFHEGEQYVNPSHPFTFDLDVFGKESLFNRINRTVTTDGSDLLANKLAMKTLPTIDEISYMKEAIDEVSNKNAFRVNWMAIAEDRMIDTGKLLDALNGIKDIETKRFPMQNGWYVITITLCVALLSTVVMSILGTLVWTIPTLLSFTLLCIGHIGCAKSLDRIATVTKGNTFKMLKCTQAVHLIASESFNTDMTSEILLTLQQKECQATEAFDTISNIFGKLEERSKLREFLFNTLYASDFFLLRKFLKWNKIQSSYWKEWIHAICQMDLLVSMANYRYNYPECTYSETIDSDKIVFEGHDFYHPFLGEKAVANDFKINDGHYYIVTGANMAGKSTFLRAVGTNYILAMCGMPVCAKGMTVSIFSLFSSMRTTDDLTRGISYFKAELLRLQQLIDYCKQNKKTLIILDEILRGTNSLDKLNGSKLFLKHIAQLPVSGIIATHDLELSRMEDSDPERFHNYCFEIQLSDIITYSYKISKGVARNQNATFLLNKMLQDS